MTAPAAPGGERRLRLRGWLRRERLLLLFTALALGLALIDPHPVADYRRWLDPPTLAALIALLVVIEGVRQSGYVQVLAQRLVRRVHDLRSLALLLTATAALLSMLLTNDVSLFLIVPLTLALSLQAELPRLRLVIVEALAVNAGSTLSPIGNPQNLILWQRSGLSMPAFMLAMLPAFALLTLLLLAFVWRLFPALPLQRLEAPQSSVRRPWLGLLSLAMLALTVLLLEHHRSGPAALLALAVFAPGFRRVLARVDWGLLATFAAMFLALGHAAQLPLVQATLGRLDWNATATVYFGGIAASQLISNVPATVLLAPYTAHAILLAGAVNVAGSGLAIGSLANLIALRIDGSRGALGAFHRISIPYLLLAMPLLYALLRLLR